jgi:hypothetical protein
MPVKFVYRAEWLLIINMTSECVKVATFMS